MTLPKRYLDRFRCNEAISLLFFEIVQRNVFTYDSVFLQPAQEVRQRCSSIAQLADSSTDCSKQETCEVTYVLRRKFLADSQRKI